MLNCCLTHCQTIHPSPAMVNNKSTRQPKPGPTNHTTKQNTPQALGGNNQHTHTPKATQRKGAKNNG